KEEPLEPGLDWDRWLGPAPMRPYNSTLSPRRVMKKDKDGVEHAEPHGHFPNWRNYKEYSGGMMTDWGAHHFDIAQWGLGMDEAGRSEIIPPDDPKAEKGVRYIYANGVPVIHASEYEPKKGVNGVLFLGENGLIEVNRGHLRSDPVEIIKQPIGEKDVKLYKS